jgi:hypothetical protein
MKQYIFYINTNILQNEQYKEFENILQTLQTNNIIDYIQLETIDHYHIKNNYKTYIYYVYNNQTLTMFNTFHNPNISEGINISMKQAIDIFYSLKDINYKALYIDINRTKISNFTNAIRKHKITPIYTTYKYLIDIPKYIHETLPATNIDVYYAIVEHSPLTTARELDQLLGPVFAKYYLILEQEYLILKHINLDPQYYTIIEYKNLNKFFTKYTNKNEDIISAIMTFNHTTFEITEN